MFLQHSEWALYLTFSTRLGYLGVRLGKYGELSIGKQWSVYHDISQYADMFIDGLGLEFYTHYNVTEKLRVMSGFNYLESGQHFINWLFVMEFIYKLRER